jgi:hypothetical protein
MTTAMTSPSHPARDSRPTPLHPLDNFAPGPADLAPLCGEPEFAAEVAGLAADEAPRLFAVVQEYGERADACIAAWGLAFPDHAEVICTESLQWMSLQAPESALRLFRAGHHLRARLVWITPVTPVGSDEAT